MKLITNIKLVIAFTAMAALFQSCIKDYENPATGTTGELFTVFALKQIYRGNEVTLNTDATGGASKIQGIVISDKTGLNTEPGTFVLQQTFASANSVTDITRGIVIKMSSGSADYNFGDSLVVNVNGAKLDRINGKLTLTGMTPEKISLIAANKTPLLRYVTQGILGEKMEEYESTLIALHADVVDYTAGGTLSGLKKLRDNTGPEVYVMTRNEASFASTPLPVNAQFSGIAYYYNETGKDTVGAKRVIAPGKAGDIQFASGALYTNFPESFETPDASVKSSYNSGTNIITAATGNWLLLQAIIGNTPASDKFNVPGKQCIRMQQNLTTSGFVQMNFDVTDGVGKVTAFYGRYATDARSTFRLEQSVNGGTTWTTVGSNITDMPDKGSKQATWIVNVTGPVRFRINKLGTGTSNNGRLNIEDIAIYKKL